MKPVRLLLGKDLRVLRRSPGVVAALVLYPLLVALIVGLVVRYTGERPRLALVDEDGLPAVMEVGGEELDVQNLFDEAAKDVRLVRMSREQAERELDAGTVLGILVIPEGFTRDVQSLVETPTVVLRTTPGGFATRTIEKTQALVYSLNRQLQTAYIEKDLGYVRMLLEGGNGKILGNDFSLIGLAEAQRRLEELAKHPDPEVAAEAEELRRFLSQATVAIEGVDDFLRAAANPIELDAERKGGRAVVLSTQVQAYALALTLAFVGLLLASAAIAAERDENVIGRLVQRLVRLRELVAEKIVLVALVAGAIGLVLAVAFGVVVEAGDVAGGEPWARLPLIVLGLLLAGAGFGALGVVVGALSQEARTATLIAFLVALPIVLIGLVPPGSVPAAGWVSDAFPFVHAARFFSSVLSDAAPAGAVAREAGWLIGLLALYSVLARVSVRRLLA